MNNYNSRKNTINMQNNMSGSKKRMSMSNLLHQEEMNFSSNQNNNFRMKNYQTHKAQNFSTGQGGLHKSRAYTKSQRDLHMFNQNRMMKSPSNRKIMKNDSSLYPAREKSRVTKSPHKNKSRVRTVLTSSRSVEIQEGAFEKGVRIEGAQLRQGALAA